MNLKFRGLYPDEIEIRVGNVSQRGATLLLYKNARVDMALLDEVVGPMNWQRDHKEVKGNLYCGIGINVGSILEYENANPITLANLLTSDVLGYLNKNFIKLNEIKLTKDNLIELVNRIDQNILSSKQSKEILNYILENGGDIDTVCDKLNIKQINDDSELINIVKNILDSNEESINDYKNGKDRAIKYLMGQIMKETKGQANPVKVNEILIKELSNY